MVSQESRSRFLMPPSGSGRPPADTPAFRLQTTNPRPIGLHNARGMASSAGAAFHRLLPGNGSSRPIRPSRESQPPPSALPQGRQTNLPMILPNHTPLPAGPYPPTSRAAEKALRFQR